MRRWAKKIIVCVCVRLLKWLIYFLPFSHPFTIFEILLNSVQSSFKYFFIILYETVFVKKIHQFILLNLIFLILVIIIVLYKMFQLNSSCSLWHKVKKRKIFSYKSKLIKSSKSWSVRYGKNIFNSKKWNCVQYWCLTMKNYKNDRIDMRRMKEREREKTGIARKKKY